MSVNGAQSLQRTVASSICSIFLQRQLSVVFWYDRGKQESACFLGLEIKNKEEKWKETTANERERRRPIKEWQLVLLSCQKPGSIAELVFFGSCSRESGSQFELTHCVCSLHRSTDLVWKYAGHSLSVRLPLGWASPPTCRAPWVSRCFKPTHTV